MKRFILLALSALIVVSAITSCAPVSDRLDRAITLASSDALANAEWLDGRLDSLPTEVIVGIGSSDEYGIDVSDFEEDGYILRTIGEETLIFGATEKGLDRAVRNYAKAADAGTVEDLDVTYHEGYRIDKLTIAGKDISEYTIVYNHDADAVTPKNYSFTVGNAQYAATELVRLVEKATGVTLPLKAKGEKVTGSVISIDYFADGEVGNRTFSYEVKNGNLNILGERRTNGCAYAVYYFLEYECGWEALLNHGDSTLREADLLDIPEGASVRVQPMFEQHFILKELRNFFYVSDNPILNWIGQYRHANHGMVKNRWAGDTMNEWYQICHTDEGLYFNTFDAVWSFVNTSVEAGQIIGETLTSVDISQGDNLNYCHCTSCMEVYQEENNAHSGAVVRFANRLAEDMEAEGFGGLTYHIFAYHGSNVPCITHPRDEVIITFCSDGACINHPLDGSQCTGVSFDMAGEVSGMERLNNNDYSAWIRGWGEISKNVYVWHYGLNCNMHQYTYMDYLYDDIMLMGNAGISGFYFEQEYIGMGLGRLRYQLISRMQWDSDMTRDEYEMMKCEVMEREFGDGYGYVDDFLSLWRSTELSAGCWNCWGYGSLIAGNDEFNVQMYAALADQMNALLDKAKLGCSDRDQEMRIERLQMDVLYKQCYCSYFDAYDAGDSETIEYLKTRYELFKKYTLNNGFSLEEFVGGLSLKPKFTLSEDLEEEAWTNWLEYRDLLTKEGAVQRPIPDKYKK